MITSEKLKLLINDPKFRNVSQKSANSREQALYKIYANQKQILRSKVVQECLVKKETLKNVDVTIDFLQSKLIAIERATANDIEKASYQKQKIQAKYKVMENINETSQKRYNSLMNSVTQSPDCERTLENVELQVQQIKQLYQENVFLKNMNNEIKDRIKEKQLKLKSKILNTP